MTPNLSQYVISEDDNRTFIVVFTPTSENLSHHESRSEAIAAIKRYEAADKRRAALDTALDTHFDKKAKKITPKQIEDELHKRFPGLKDKLIVI